MRPDEGNLVRLLPGVSQAELLLELGVDGYCKNGAGRSALSMGIETLPALAVRLPERPAETSRD